MNTRGRNPFGGPRPHVPLTGNAYAPPGPPVSTNDPVDGGTIQRYSSSKELVDGRPQVLCNFSYPGAPRPLTVSVMCPFAGNQAVENVGLILDSTGTKELWVLGEAEVGLGGSSFAFSFDMPFDQVAQFSCVAETLKVTARLILAPVPSPGGGGGPSAFLSDFLDPPAFGGTVQAAIGKVIVRGIGGDGFSGLSNLTRRARFPALSSAVVGQCPPPNLANVYRTLGDTTAKVDQLTTAMVAGVATPLDFPAGLVNPFDDVPICDNLQNLQITPTALGAKPFEIVWRLGFGGMPS